ncbi:hypothetical protein CC1G_04595 [Coprinopsis cinerea okayama7|uniref:Uncharacterized protein n=1 Tax=Coprinopsis cinerea (strain Okayama-7 / 130 / ATCC MYA-4618 / FGSC 9003) TaxID=240176 RepID=A8N517_COPC7|nr:hypothetical protein CC1G_04595 [Coprinopsis cinerea okayama7\|eukprot:XP_001829906.1 hypothetical protein CC1G_04595 [Coprinopsis cinerea okayama7\
MPATTVIRAALRQRCKVNLRIYTALSPYIDDLPIYIEDNHLRSLQCAKPKGAVAPPKNVQSTFAVRAQINTELSQQTIPRIPKSSPFHQFPDFESFYELVPYLSLAFSDGDFTPEIAARFNLSPNTNEFTHFLKIVDAKSPSEAGRTILETDEYTGTQTLTLPIYHHPPPNRRRDYTLLSDRQLLAARDFLSLALPYFSEGRPNLKKRGSSDMAHVLMTAPKGIGGAVDVMSIAACYLSYASMVDIDTVVEHMDEAIGYGGKGWVGVIGEDGLDRIAQVTDSEERLPQLQTTPKRLN